jgi:hypothetical protein
MAIEDGFKYPNNIHLTSNPLWEDLKTQVNEYKSKYPVDGNGVITFYSQSGKTFDTPLELTQSVLRLCSSVKKTEKTLLIKCHPIEEAPPYEWLLRQLPKSLTQKVVFNKKMSLSESLCKSTEVTSLFSTVLLDAKMIGFTAYRGDCPAAQAANRQDMDKLLDPSPHI